MDTTGYILTNEHVVRGSRWVTLITHTGARLTAYVAAVDAGRDIALVKVDMPFHSVLSFATEAREGEEVIALGYPFGYELGQSMTITTGIVSALRTYDGVAYVQTDSALNPGNSGGPLLNLRGAVVGMNTAGITDAQGLNFAIRYDVLSTRLPILLGDATTPPTVTHTPTPTPEPVALFGPINREIEHKPDDGKADGFYATGVSIEDGTIEAHFYNPYSTTVGDWSYGFLFRLRRLDDGTHAFHAVVITGEGYFQHYLRVGADNQRLAARHVGEIHTEEGARNHIRIIADGREGKLYINSYYIANLQLQGLMESGSVYAVGSYFTGHGVAGYSTRLTGFTIWPVEDKQQPAAPTPTPTPYPQPTTKVLNWRASSAVTKLSPYTAVSGYVGLIGNHIFSRLLIADPHEQKFIPELAERWSASPDGMSVTFYLRKNAFFHDGEPVTAEDVRWSFESHINSRTNSRLAWSLSLIKGAGAFADGIADSVEGIVIVDDYTIRFDMAFPTGQFIPAAGPNILPEHILGRIAPEDLDEHEFFTGLGAQKPIGSGPWKFVKHEPDQFHELVSSDDYFLGKPKIDRVFVHLITSVDAAQIAMRRGEIDASRRGGFAPEVNETFLSDPRFLVAATGRRNNGGGYSFNFRTDWIRDSRIHQAHMWALNRKLLVDTFEGGLGYIHNSHLFVPTGVETPEMMARYTHEGDTAKARQLLEEAGWDFDREITEKAPGYTGPILVQFAAEQQMLADAGLKVKYETMETQAWAAVYYENYNYDSVRVGGWGGTVDAMDYYFHSTLSNPMGYANPELDALLDKVPRALTNQELVDIGIKMNEMFIKDLPIVVISSPLRLYTYGAHVWVPGFGRRPQPNRLEDIQFTPEFHGQDDSWNYLIHETDIVYFGDIHPLNLTGPLARQIAIQGP